MNRTSVPFLHLLAQRVGKNASAIRPYVPHTHNSLECVYAHEYCICIFGYFLKVSSQPCPYALMSAGDALHIARGTVGACFVLSFPSPTVLVSIDLGSWKLGSLVRSSPLFFQSTWKGRSSICRVRKLRICCVCTARWGNFLTVPRATNGYFSPCVLKYH